MDDCKSFGDVTTDKQKMPGKHPALLILILARAEFKISITAFYFFYHLPGSIFHSQLKVLHAFPHAH